MRQFLFSSVREAASQQEIILAVFNIYWTFVFWWEFRVLFYSHQNSVSVDKVSPSLIVTVNDKYNRGVKSGVVWCGVVWCAVCSFTVMNNVPTSLERPFINFFSDWVRDLVWSAALYQAGVSDQPHLVPSVSKPRSQHPPPPPASWPSSREDVWPSHHFY